MAISGIYPIDGSGFEDEREGSSARLPLTETNLFGLSPGWRKTWQSSGSRWVRRRVRARFLDAVIWLVRPGGGPGAGAE
ncbi:hypothetical protein [Escherichia coli]|uniref:hypothetical protein n=1 Tax=Escherichia coli TaxID=562 RepID=UPI00388D7783